VMGLKPEGPRHRRDGVRDKSQSLSLGIGGGGPRIAARSLPPRNRFPAGIGGASRDRSDCRLRGVRVRRRAPPVSSQGPGKRPRRPLSLFGAGRAAGVGGAAAATSFLAGALVIAFFAVGLRAGDLAALAFLALATAFLTVGLRAGDLAALAFLAGTLAGARFAGDVPRSLLLPFGSLVPSVGSSAYDRFHGIAV
jgi:hypothetical protein